MLRWYRVDCEQIQIVTFPTVVSGQRGGGMEGGGSKEEEEIRRRKRFVLSFLPSWARFSSSPFRRSLPRSLLGKRRKGQNEGK